MQPLPAWAAERPRPSRQYVIGSRRCRQRLAQMLAAGRSPERAALVERRSLAEVELLLEDEGFAGLVEHYRTMAELPEEEKLAALKAMALDLLHLALQVGDVRTAVFFAYEDLHKRNPAQSLALAAIRAARRAAERETPRPEVRRSIGPRAEPRREADFAYCAATQPSPTHAAALAAEEARALPARVARTGRTLTGRLLAEAEREGTATAEPLGWAVETFAREAHEQGGKTLDAAACWQARREAFAKGRVAAAGRTDGGRATLASPSRMMADPPVEPEGDEEEVGPGTREGPAPATLPDWLDRVPGANGAQLLAMKPEERAVTLATIARFYGFDTS